eukprot:202604_1
MHIIHTCCPYPDELITGDDWQKKSNDYDCSVRPWSTECNEECAKYQCEGYNGWWQDLDFSSNPYTCCAYAKSISCGNGIGGWSNKANSNCCIKSWSPECGEACSKAQCTVHGGNWINLDYATNPYTCCP